MPRTGSLILVHFLKPLSEDDTVSRRKYPLHVTVVPWFKLGSAIKENIFSSISKIAKETKPFQFSVKGEALFGPENDVPVNLVTKSEDLTKLHLKLAYTIEASGAIIESKYVKDFYRPHISHTGALKAQPGDTCLLDNLALLQLLPDEITCQVIKTYSLDGLSNNEIR